MRRYFLYFISALITFSIGYFLFVITVNYNMDVMKHYAVKRKEAEYVAPVQPKLVSLKELLREGIFQKIDEELGNRCLSFPPELDKAVRAKCAQYYRMLAALDK